MQFAISLMQHPQFTRLSPGARCLYYACVAECGGRRNFQMPESTAARYGIKHNSLIRYRKELQDAGFINREQSGKNTRTPNEYSFSFDWYMPP